MSSRPSSSVANANSRRSRSLSRRVPQRIFDREPRLADPSQPSQSMQRLASDGRRLLLLIHGESLVQLIEKCLAALKKGAERGEGEIARLAHWFSGSLLRQ